MSAGFHPWVILAIGDPAKQPRKTPVDAIEGPEAMLRRALSLTSPAKVCCVIADSFLREWASVYGGLGAANRYSLAAGETILEGLERCLASINEQDPRANVTVIPFNHCAVEEVSWLDSAKGALRLGSKNRNTVYLLHDNPDNDPRVALKKPDVCTSSVMVGAAAALLALCAGKRATTVVELVAGPPEDTDRSFAEAPSPTGSSLNVVHVRLMEEYARLQGIDVRHSPSSRINIEV